MGPAATPRIDRRSLAAGLGLAALFAVTRVSLYEEHFFNWDATQLGLSLERFDVAWHRPHPPGYGLYVVLSRGVQWVFGSTPELTLQVLSTLMSGVGILGVFVLARRFRAGLVAWLAATAAVLNPIVWAYGIVGESYAGEFAACTWVGVLAIDGYRGNRRAALAAGFLLGLSGGIRASVTLFLTPLVVVALLRAPIGLARRVAALGLAAVGCLMWLVPTVLLSGGLDRYLFITRQLTMEVIAKTVSPLFALTELGPENVWLALTATATGVLVFPAGAALLATLVRSRGRAPPPGDQLPMLTVFAALWTGPALVFYAAFFMSKPGYVLTYAAPYFVLGAALLARFVDAVTARAPALRRVAVIAAWSVSTLPGAVQFLGEFELRSAPMSPISLASIRLSEVALGAALEVPALEEARLGGRVAVLSNNDTLDWRRLAYYDPTHLELKLLDRNDVPVLGDRVEALASFGGRVALGSGSDGFWGRPFQEFPATIEVALGDVDALIGFLPDRVLSAVADGLGADAFRLELREHRGLRYAVIDLRGRSELWVGSIRLRVGGEPLTFQRQR